MLNFSTSQHNEDDGTIHDIYQKLDESDKKAN